MTTGRINQIASGRLGNGQSLRLNCAATGGSVLPWAGRGHRASSELRRRRAFVRSGGPSPLESGLCVRFVCVCWALSWPLPSHRPSPLGQPCLSLCVPLAVPSDRCGGLSLLATLLLSWREGLGRTRQALACFSPRPTFSLGGTPPSHGLLSLGSPPQPVTPISAFVLKGREQRTPSLGATGLTYYGVGGPRPPVCAHPRPSSVCLRPGHRASKVRGDSAGTPWQPSLFGGD